MANRTLSLEERIQALAQELQDMILDFTIAIETHSTIVITDDYRPPTKQLSINRKTRAKLAEDYYGTNAFTWHIWRGKALHIPPWIWLPKLAPKHRDMLQDLHLSIDWSFYNSALSAQPVRFCIKYIDELGRIMYQRGIELDQEIVKMNFRIKTRTESGEEKVEEKWMNKKELMEMRP